MLNFLFFISNEKYQVDFCCLRTKGGGGIFDNNLILRRNVTITKQTEQKSPIDIIGTKQNQ